MRYRKSFLRSMIIASGVIAAGVGMPVAAADPGAGFPVVHTLGDTCYGQLRSGIEAVGPGTARFGMSFVKWTPTFGNACGVGVSVHWRNLDTGAAGMVFTPIVDSTSWNQTPPTVFREVATGPGRVSFTITTDRLFLPVTSVELVVS
ncbi:hypothetical protein ACFXK0_26695 [Nocardia sp. NPDC059177]|uniref:hypothetical protein n=1 Tax=Nocardia sp. NPDC059177 TaxID=3346759 RepID=UPI003697247A